MAKALNNPKQAPKKFSIIKSLLAYDRTHKYRGRSKKPQCYLIGTDEVGRGCFAGPVVAAAVMLPHIEDDSELCHKLVELNDSKLVKPAVRETLSNIIKEVSVWAIAEASVEEINEINILQASLLAMRRAMHDLKSQIPDALPTLVLVDGNKAVKDFEHLQTTVIGGDSTSASIAAASIIAKVYRDKLMHDLAAQHPQYDWHQNKGYGSPAHRKALKAHGMTAHHRVLFSQKFVTGIFSDAEEAENYIEDLIDDAVERELVAN